ncbi:hypothetical protein G6714_01410 [Polynucleobacter paneuropaeus]|nr:hypothetical protein [Polynucleobacter paneuropaeus]
MKKILMSLFITTLSGAALAQASFEGFYGQIATGYESNTASNLNMTPTLPDFGYVGPPYSGSNQTFGGAPLVLGLGYNFSVSSNWLLGIGADYSLLGQKSPTFSETYYRSDGQDSFNGNQLTVSNRFNIFLAPGYVIDKDKLVYVKAGYSSLNLKETFANQLVNVDSGKVTQNPYQTPSQTNTLSGFIVGMGYKQMIGSGFYGFAEANYMSYGQKTFNSYSNSLGYTAVLSNSPNLSSYQVLVGIGYKF